ncbi:MAG: acetyltransferase [Verrucomicrobia bacterium]|nr:acetyltransferase [Verrucomicrobiota bacterium]
MLTLGKAATGAGLIVFGAGGHGKVVVEAALLSGWQVGWVVDDSPRRSEVLGIAVSRHDLSGRVVEGGTRFIVAVGDNRSRARIFDELIRKGLESVVVTHPAAIVSAHAQLGGGTFVGAGAVVMAGTRMGKDVIVNTAASVDHDCEIGDHVHICPGVRLAGEAKIGSFAMIGTGAVVLPRVRVGQHCVVGAGAVVTRDLPEYSVSVGVPARITRHLINRDVTFNNSQ